MATQQKILVCGDVEGQFTKLFNRVSSIQKKAGQFDMLFCVGNFFGDDNKEWEALKTGQIKAPVETFILGPSQSHNSEYFTDPNGAELCPNVTYLGEKGVYSGSSGLQVAYLSGTQALKHTPVNFTAEDVQALQLPLVSDSKFKGVDILITSQWPKGVEKYGSAVEGVDSTKCGSSIISQLAINLRPRYHVCGLEGAYYERQPYRNHKVLQEGARHVTRFLALAKVGNTEKKKFIYAFNIVPLKSMETAELTRQPQDVTECPYPTDAALLKPQQDKGAQFFYDQKSIDNPRRPGGGRGGKRQHGQDGAGPNEKRKPPQPTGPCWFCLSSPEVEKHLVVSVGDESYLTIAKGPLVPDHILILPIAHYQSIVSAPPGVRKEIEKYKGALRKCLKKQGKAVVFFERNYKTQHLQIQAVPIPAEMSVEVQETMVGCALSQNFELHEIPTHSDISQIVPEGAPYFYAELPGGEKLLNRIKKGFPLQFGREALAHDSLLNMPHKVDWRNCKYSKEQEAKMASDFREKFEPFDFNEV